MSAIRPKHVVGLDRIHWSGHSGLGGRFKPDSVVGSLRIAQSHWSTENSLHWVLDVTMKEDSARNRIDNGPENIALIRKWALNIAKSEGSKGSIKGKLKRAEWDNAFLAKLLARTVYTRLTQLTGSASG